MYYKEQEIIAWAYDKGIIQKADRLTQSLKTLEEVAELTTNVLKNRDISDDIGDIYVTIVVQAHMSGLGSIQDLHTNLYEFKADQEHDSLKDKVAYLIQDVAMMIEGIQGGTDISWCISNIYNGLICICDEQKLSLPSCIDIAYNEIKGRKGKMVDGVFVKDS